MEACIRHGLGIAVHRGRDDGTCTLGHLRVEAGAVALAPCQGSVLRLFIRHTLWRPSNFSHAERRCNSSNHGWVGGRWRPWRGITHRFETAKRR